MGNVYHKTLKHHLVADKTPGTEGSESKSAAIAVLHWLRWHLRNNRRDYAEYKSELYGESVTVSWCLAAGNGIFYLNPHPHAKRISAYAVDLVNRAVLAAGAAPKISWRQLQIRTMETSK